jgi:hypothetical protein
MLEVWKPEPGRFRDGGVLGQSIASRTHASIASSHEVKATVDLGWDFFFVGS